MLKPTGLINGHYECRSLDETLPIFTDLLALEVVEREDGVLLRSPPPRRERITIEEFRKRVPPYRGPRVSLEDMERAIPCERSYTNRVTLSGIVMISASPAGLVKLAEDEEKVERKGRVNKEGRTNCVI